MCNVQLSQSNHNLCISDGDALRYQIVLCPGTWSTQWLIFSAHPVWKWSRKIKHLYHFSTCNQFVQLSIARSSNRSVRLTTDPSDGIFYHTQKDFLIISMIYFSEKIVSQHTSSMCRRRGNFFEKRMLLMAFISKTLSTRAFGNYGLPSVNFLAKEKKTVIQD